MANVFDNNIRVDASGNVTIAGNLTVSGATNTISATNTVITDKLIELGNGVSGTPSGVRARHHVCNRSQHRRPYGDVRECQHR